MPPYESGLFTFKKESHFDSLKIAVKGLSARDLSGFYYYTLHNIEHIDSCMEILELFFGKLKHCLPDLDYIFNDKDRKLLVAAVYLHDIGLYITENRQDVIEANKQGKDIYEYIRETHHERIENKIAQWNPQLRSCGLDDLDISHLCMICRGHRKVNLDEYPRRIRKLSALLRLIDELDISKNRTPAEFLNEHLLAMDLRARWHWIKHNFVTQWHEGSVVCNMNGAIPKLVFNLTHSLPEEYNSAIFLQEIIRPIKRVIEEEGVGNILKNDWGFEVEIGANIQRLLGIPHSIAGIDLIDSLKYYLNYHEIEMKNSLKPGDEVNFEKYCRKISDKYSDELDVSSRINIKNEYYLCLEKIYKNELEKKAEEFANHYKNNIPRKAVKYFLIWANMQNSYIPTDAITDKIFITDKAIEIIEEAYNTRISDKSQWPPREEYSLLIEYGRLKRFTGDWKTARGVFEKCLELSDQIGDDEIKAESLLELGSLIFEMGKTGNGLAYVNQALDIQKLKGIGPGLVKTLKALGNMLREQGDWEQAFEVTKLATDLMKFQHGKSTTGKSTEDEAIKKTSKDIVDKMILCDCHRELGNLYACMNEVNKAKESFKKSLEYTEQANSADTFKHLKGIILYHQGNLELKQNNIPNAEKYLEESKQILEQFENPIRKTFVYDALGRLHSQLLLPGDLEKAENYFKNALDLRRISGHEYFAGLSHYNLGVLYKKWIPPRLDDAINEVQTAIEIFSRLGKFEAGDAHFTLGKIYLMQERKTDAEEQFEKAKTALIEIYKEDSEKVRTVEYELKKLQYGDNIPFNEINYLIEAGEYRFHDWLRENVKIPGILLSDDHIESENPMERLSHMLIGGVQSGDDAAIIHIPYSSKYDLLLTTDAAPGSLTDSDDIEKAKYAARFSVVHSTSDILAMGGIPVAVLLNLYLTRKATFAYAKAIVESVQAEAEKYGMALIGGDLKERNHQSIGCVGIGLIEKGKAVCRKGAEIGDIVAVTLSQNIKLGTRWLHEVIKYQHLEDQFGDFLQEDYLQKHLLLPWKEMLAATQTENLTSAIDTSDGILSCLQLIGKFNQVGFILEERLLKEIVHPDVEFISKKMAWNPIQFLFNAGHDWEIVVTVNKDKFEQTRRAVQATGGDLAPIGTIVDRTEHKIKPGTIKIKMEGKPEIDFPYFTDEKFVWNPYQNRIQEWLDLSTLFLK